MPHPHPCKWKEHYLALETAQVPNGRIISRIRRRRAADMTAFRTRMEIAEEIVRESQCLLKLIRSA